MKKNKILNFGLWLTAMHIGILPTTSCNKQINVSTISLECKGEHYTSEETTYVLINESCHFKVTILPENATNKNVTWSIEKPAESTAEATIDQNGNVKFTKHGEVNLIATAKDGSNVKGTIHVRGLDETDTQEISKYYFCNDEWSEICYYANEGYDKLLEHYAGLATLDNPFLGLERKITINGRTHIARVVDENHDTIAGGDKKAALTFELVTLLSNSSGKAMCSQWDASDSKDYTNSILRANLTGQGKGKIGWTESSETRTAFQMLPSDLQNNIKTVNKKVATYDTATASYIVSEAGYNDTLFPLTYTEIGGPETSYVKVEGTTYKYWTGHHSKRDRIKKDNKGTPCLYWLCSPYKHDRNVFASYIDKSGGISGSNVTLPHEGISFGFCI